jgi:hypothetical protein
MYELFLRYEFSKITHRIRKKLFQSSRTYAVKWQFFAKNHSYFCLPASEIDAILKEQRMLFIPTKGIKLPPRQSICLVVLLIICRKFEYINSLSLRDTHRLKKQNIESDRTFAVKRNIWNNIVQARLTNHTLKR